jgi:transcription termination/antitermination protein NusG
MTQNSKKTRKSQSSTVESDQDFILLDSAKPRWYVIQTYVGFEDAVKKLIEQKIENLSLQEKIFEIYIPNKKVIKLNAKGERKEKIEKIYPGYIYINAILDKETGYLIQNTNYVSRIASTGNVAVALEEGYIEKLKDRLQKESTEGKVSASTSKFRIGDLIKVIDGPFKDMTGKVEAIEDNSSRVTVMLSIFDRETEVLLDVLEIQHWN